MPLFDLTEFFKLSSALNYNLSAASLNRYNVLMYIIGNRRLDADEKIDREQKGILMEALGYLFSAYSHKRRRLGPMAVPISLFSQRTKLYRTSSGSFSMWAGFFGSASCW